MKLVRNIDIRIDRTINGASYDYLAKIIRVNKNKNWKDYNVSRIASGINHEYLHHVLYKLEGLDACIKMDVYSYERVMSRQSLPNYKYEAEINFGVW